MSAIPSRPPATTPSNTISTTPRRPHRPRDRWARHRVAALAIAAGLDHHAITVTTTPEAFTTATGIDIGPTDHGMASWADARVIYVDPAKAANCGDLELVIAHELGHLRWPSLGHRAQFFERVQQLLDHAR